MKTRTASTILAFTLALSASVQPITPERIQVNTKPEVSNQQPSLHSKPEGQLHRVFSGLIPTMRMDGNVTINGVEYISIINNENPFLQVLFQNGEQAGCFLDPYVRIYEGPNRRTFTDLGNGLTLEAGDLIFSVYCLDQPRKLVVAKPYDDGRNTQYLYIHGVLEDTITQDLEDSLANG